LLDFAFDPGLQRIFDEYVRALKDRGRKLCLARAIAADRVDVHAEADHGVGQDDRQALVGR